MRRGETKRLPRLWDGEGGREGGMAGGSLQNWWRSVRLRGDGSCREQGRGTVTETVTVTVTVTELSTGAECYGRDERFGI